AGEHRGRGMLWRGHKAWVMIGWQYCIVLAWIGQSARTRFQVRSVLKGMIATMHPRLRTHRSLVAFGFLLLAGDLAGGSDWSRFRGPNGTGVAADKDVPVKWTTDNVLWKTSIPGVGHSSPIFHGGRVFLQSSSSDGKDRWLISLDAATGRILWKT